jgi:hypothetical protein
MSAYLHIPGSPAVLEFSEPDPTIVVEKVKELRASNASTRTFADGQRCMFVDFAAVSTFFVTTAVPSQETPVIWASNNSIGA